MRGPSVGTPKEIFDSRQEAFQRVEGLLRVRQRPGQVRRVAQNLGEVGHRQRLDDRLDLTVARIQVQPATRRHSVRSWPRMMRRSSSASPPAITALRANSTAWLTSMKNG